MTSPEFPAPEMSEVQLVDILRAVADPIRLEIVRVLADGEPHSKPGDEWGFDVHKSTLSHHFKALREGGLTLTFVSGRTHAIQLRRRELDEKFPGLIDALVTAGQSPAARPNSFGVRIR